MQTDMPQPEPPAEGEAAPPGESAVAAGGVSLLPAWLRRARPAAAGEATPLPADGERDLLSRAALAIRLKAVLIHLGISITAFLPVLYLILVHWYPSPYFATTGGWQGLRIMLLVDVVLGPMLTLVIYNPYKALRLIKLDFCIIACIQISAFCWGVYAVHSQRPVSISFYQGVFYPVQAADYREQEVTPEEIRGLSEEHPPLVHVREPANEQERVGVLAYELVSSVPSYAVTFLFEPLAADLEALRMASLDLQASPDPALLEAKQRYLAAHPHTGEVLLLPLVGRYGRSILVFDAATAGLLGAMEAPTPTP